MTMMMMMMMTTTGINRDDDDDGDGATTTTATMMTTTTMAMVQLATGYDDGNGVTVNYDSDGVMGDYDDVQRRLR